MVIPFSPAYPPETPVLERDHTITQWCMRIHACSFIRPMGLIAVAETYDPNLAIGSDCENMDMEYSVCVIVSSSRH